MPGGCLIKSLLKLPRLLATPLILAGCVQGPDYSKPAEVVPWSYRNATSNRS